MKAFKIILMSFVTLIIVTTIVVIPFIIPQFIRGDILELTEGDILAYIGAMIGSTATIIAVILTIRHSRKLMEQERSISIRPWLFTYFKKCSIEEFIKKENDDDLFIQLGLTGGASLSREPFVELIKHSQDEMTFEIGNRLFGGVLLLNHYVSNFGAGNIIDFEIRHNGFPVIRNEALRVNQTRVFKYYFDITSLKDKTHKIEIEYLYYDVSKIKMYLQRETINIKHFEGLGPSYAQVGEEFLTRPKEVHTKNSTL